MKVKQGLKALQIPFSWKSVKCRYIKSEIFLESYLLGSGGAVEDASIVSGVASVVGAIGRAGLRTDVDCSGLGPSCVLANIGTVMCRGYGVPEMVTPAMRTTTVTVLLVFET